MSRTERTGASLLENIPSRRPTDISWHRGSRSIVYLIHGVTGTPMEMSYVGAGLARLGWDVYVPTLPGHCLRLKDLVRTTEADWRKQVVEQLAFLRATYDFVFAAGLSAGALLALDASQSVSLAGIGVLSPTFIYDGWNTPWSHAILPLCMRFVPRFLQPLLFHIDGPPFGIKNPALQEKVRKAYHPWASMGEWVDVWWPWSRKKEHVPLAVTNGNPLFPLCILAEINRLIQRVRAALPEVTVPTLILQAKEDDMTGPSNGKLVYDSIRSEKKSLVLLDDCYHVITVDKEKKKVVTSLHEFFSSFQALLLIACLFFHTTAHANSQETPSHPTQKSWGLWLGGSDTTPVIFSRVPRKFGIAAIQMSEELIDTRIFRLEYTCDFIPALIVHQPKELRSAYFGPGSLERIEQPSKSIWGMGVAPVGLRMNFAPTHRLYPFLALSSGGAYTTEKIPYQIPGGTNFNFLFQMGGGLRWTMTSQRDMLLGFSWWHMSNGRLSVVNPGIDANLWYVAFLFS